MADFIQTYGEGYIARQGKQYQYVVDEKVKGTYDSVSDLVEAQDGASTGATDSDATNESQPVAKGRKAKVHSSKE